MVVKWFRLAQNFSFPQNLALIEGNKAFITIAKILRIILKENKTKFLLLLIAFLFATPIYFSQYTKTYNDSGKRNQLTLEGMYFDKLVIF